MKILLVDDNARKIKKIIEHLTSTCGLNRNNIEVSQSATDARRALAANSFDVLLLDILLPLRPEDDPLIETSVELLTEICDLGSLIRPRQIIGLTAYGDAASAAAPHFSGRVWTIIHYDETNDAWLAPIEKCVAYVRAQTEQGAIPGYGVDLCIVTALQEPEMRAIHRLPWNWEPATPLDDSTFYTKGTFVSGGKTYDVVSSVAPRMGMVAAALLSSKLISAFRPRFAVMAGICAGVKGKTNIGDVILADPTWDYQSGKRVRDKDNTQFAMAPHQLQVPEFIRARAEQLRTATKFWNDVRNYWPNPPDTILRLLIGPLASGSAVLADGNVVAEIKDQNRNLLAVEMEAYGLYAAASLSPLPRTTAFALKAVCDYADPDKKDEHQAFAAYTSAQAVKEFFERYMHEIGSNS